MRKRKSALYQSASKIQSMTIFLLMALAAEIVCCLVFLALYAANSGAKCYIILSIVSASASLLSSGLIVAAILRESKGISDKE